MHRQTLILQLFTGQNQMFTFLNDAPDAAGAWLAPHCNKIERLVADAQVLLVRLPACLRAHGLHPVQLFRLKERLRGSVTAAVVLDVSLPLVLVESFGQPAANVPLDEGVEGIVPLGRLAGSVIFGRRLMPQQEEDGEREKNPESSHYPADLGRNTDCKVTTAGTKKLYFTLYHSVNLLFLILRYVRVCQRAEFDQVLLSLSLSLSVCLSVCSRTAAISWLIASVSYVNRPGRPCELRVTWNLQLWHWCDSFLLSVSCGFTYHFLVLCQQWEWPKLECFAFYKSVHMAVL